MPDRDLPAVHQIGLPALRLWRGPVRQHTEVWCQMSDDLVAKEIKIDPMVRRAPFGAS